MICQKIFLTLLILSLANPIKVEVILVRKLLMRLNELFDNQRYYDPNPDRAEQEAGIYDYNLQRARLDQSDRIQSNQTGEDIYLSNTTSTNNTDQSPSRSTSSPTISTLTTLISNQTTSPLELGLIPGLRAIKDSSEPDLTANSSTIDSSTESVLSTTDLLPTSTTTRATTSTTSVRETTENSQSEVEENKKGIKDRERCVFYKVHTGKTRLKVEPNSNETTICLKSQNLSLSIQQDSITNDTSLPVYNDDGNLMQVNLKSESPNSFQLEIHWTELNVTMNESSPHDKYGILLSIYENMQLIGKVFLVDKLILSKSKEIEFSNLKDKNNFTYSISLSKVNYFDQDRELNDFRPENVRNPNHYLIRNVYESIEKIERFEAMSRDELNPNRKIAIYVVASLLLLMLIVGLLYYRKDKFKSLLNERFDNTPRHQNSKYVRKTNQHPAINISNYENGFQENPFEQQFIKNTAQLSNGDRLGGFGMLNNYQPREKRSMSKMSIGRALIEQVATIKKRASLQPISARSTVVEFDLKKRDTKYSQSIPLIEFLPLLNELMKSNNQKLFNEFMQLDILTNDFNTLKKTSNKVARISKNLQKNKDACILPYDHSRVVLEMNRFLTSDYINSSYIPGVNSAKEYIACQSPLKSTTYAFWLMCIQQNVKYIVMTTQLIDSYTTLDKYWPDLFVEDGDSFKQIENIIIKLIDKRKFHNYTVRTFELKMNDESRLIKHFQLTEWKEIANPHNVMMLTEFLRVFRDEIGFNEPITSNNDWNESPIVVHCSNGVGKTAIFIAVDRIFVQLKKGKNDHIDIFRTVIEMRQYRPAMIQNEAQYKLIYECVGELVKKMYPDLVKQMEFDRTLDEINLKETNDFDANNNLNTSNNSQIFLIDALKRSGDKSLPEIKLNGFTNQTFVSHDEPS